MKKVLYHLSLLLVLTAPLAGCKKDKDDPQPAKSRTELLTNKNWRLTAATIDPAIDLFGTGTATTNLFAQYPDCTKDDLSRFENGGVFKDDEGATKCSPTAPQTATGTWTFSADESKVTTTVSGSTTTLNISELSENALKGTVVEDFGTPINYTISFTFAKQ